VHLTGSESRTTSPVALLCDGVRVAALISVVVGLIWYGGVAGALFFLVLGGTMIPRALQAPAALDASYCVAILFAAWAAELDWYLAVGWLDVVVHAAATGLVAAMAHLALVRIGAVAPVDDVRLRRPRLGSAVVTTTLGVTLAVVWEFGEWFGHTRLDDRIQVGYTDTMGDLVAGTVGALVAAVLLARGVLLVGERR
jgi:hypothetical protein